MRVLLVDDDPVTRRGIAKVLEHAGMTVFHAPNAHAAFAELRGDGYDAIVCDLRLPFLRGEEFYRQVKDMFPTMGPRTVFLTGVVDDPEVRRFLAATGQPYLFKPFEADELVEAVQQVGRPDPGTDQK